MMHTGGEAIGYFALLTGLGAGALHALSGPDHLLSLVPLSVGQQRRGGWRLGMLWGVGHGLGTLAAVAVLIAVVQAAHLEGLERWAERVAALALVATGAWGLKRRAASAEDAEPARRGVLGVGLVHGLTGAAALLLLLPAVVSGTAGERVLYLGGFSVGSTLAMAALTAALAALSQVRRLPAVLGERVPRFASALSMVVGGAWIAASL